MTNTTKTHALHYGLLAILAIAFMILPQYHSGNLARVMVLAIYAMGYNILFGYTGLLSLGHALFFSAGMYGLGLTMHLGGWTPAPAFLAALLASAVVATVIGFLVLRTSGVAFMIVTLMFAQAGYLTILYFGTYTRGDEGFALQQATRQLMGLDLTDQTIRYYTALILFSATLLLLAYFIRSPFGRTLIAIRENEERAKMLGYNVTAIKLKAVILSGVISGASGGAYALLFGNTGATFATVQFSILPLLWVLVGGAGTTTGPFIGVLFMTYLIDYASGQTTAYLIVVGVVLVLVTLFLPHGIVGTLRNKYAGWLP
ncbi:branched-chain amino acid ABC transporter permease [Amylibacter sp. IMCC11727]|uniref:branched-chain amino acid ABC transporter permease n=1 Tax=Amylibacter sp. IMCC11727 TaxID=3039851 RepID=UPI00244DB94C|nr:branched-chain amino acid ABC transporter permease [Amylibacter sp. IMCC11727]WGI23068.1 branched-chain amino acid ABC transporter permease [Amylibacter sp. IMCC11727]